MNNNMNNATIIIIIIITVILPWHYTEIAEAFIQSDGNFIDKRY